MISGNVSNEFSDQQIAVLPVALQSTIRFLKENDLAAREPGRFNIELGGAPVILQVLDLNIVPRETLRPEIHRRNIDVQFPAVGGLERVGRYSDDRTNQMDEDLLDTLRDISFHHNNPNAPEGTIELVPGTYAVYFPWGAHISAVQAGASPASIRKIVIKVPMSAHVPVAEN